MLQYTAWCKRSAYFSVFENFLIFSFNFVIGNHFDVRSIKTIRRKLITKLSRYLLTPLWCLISYIALESKEFCNSFASLIVYNLSQNLSSLYNFSCQLPGTKIAVAFKTAFQASKQRMKGSKNVLYFDMRWRRQIWVLVQNGET